MLTLSSGSSCDVCAEEYGPQTMPHCIPCGHVLCASCCNTIAEKTSPRLTPVCPFCREEFTHDSIRLIRIDFNVSGWSAPRRRIVVETDDLPHDHHNKKEERIVYMDNDTSRARAGARALEDKVARVAAKKCSVEEVTTLHKELQDWLGSEVDHKTSSLYLSAALLRAILLNHVAHSEACKVAKLTEANLKARLDDLEMMNTKLEAEVKRQRLEFSHKAQECQTLAAELNRPKVSSHGVPKVSPHGVPTPRPPSVHPPISTASSQVASASSTPIYAPTARSAVSRFQSLHLRSASVQPQSSLRSYTPVTTSRSDTPMTHPHAQMHTPRPTVSASASPSRSRKHASPSPPPAMSRSSSSTSDDSDQIHERWLPSRDPDEHVSPSSRTARFIFAPTSVASTAAAAASRSPSVVPQHR